MKSAILTCFLATASWLQVSCQINSQVAEIPSIQVRHINDDIVIDEILDESIWMFTTPVSNMHQKFPNDSLLAINDTEISMAYDEDNLYVAITCFSQTGHYRTTSLHRDYDFFGNDNITLVFDNYYDYTNALAFGMNAFGVRKEGTVVNAGQEPDDLDESWDNKWRGADLDLI